MGIDDKLLEWKQLIEQAKLDQASIGGQIESVSLRFQREFGCKTIREAEKKLITLIQMRDTLKDVIKDGLEELEGTDEKAE